MASIDQIRESLDARITEARNEIEKLEAARKALQSDRGRRATNGAGASPRRRGAQSRAPRSASAPDTPARPITTTASAVRSRGGDGASDTTPASTASASASATTTRDDEATGASPAPEKSEATPDISSSKPRARAARRTTRSRKRPEILLAGKLEVMLRAAENGLSVPAIVKQANARDGQVRELLRELEQTGRVRRTGASRASRWQLITDEERITQRAAELERLSTPKSD